MASSQRRSNSSSLIGGALIALTLVGADPISETPPQDRRPAEPTTTAANTESSEVEQSAGVKWHADLDEAVRVARQQDKDLFINFTGTEWCGPCGAFEHDVLDRPQFAPAGRDFVLVELDFPSSDDDIPDVLREKYVLWRDAFGITVFPTVCLTDTSLKLYAMTGHIGVGPEEYVKHLRILKEAGERRNLALSKAGRTTGAERIRYLAEALSAVREACGSNMIESNGDPLMRFYRPEIDEILSSDHDNTAALRDKYGHLLDTQDERDRIAAIYDRMDLIRVEDGLDAAIRYADHQIQEATTTELRNRLRRSRLVLLEWADRHDEALAFARELSDDDSFSIEQRRSIRGRIAHNLQRLGRIDEAITIYDELIREVHDDADAALSLHWTKAGTLQRAGRLEAAIQTWESARKYVEPPTEDWFQVVVLRAQLLRRAGHLDEAIAAFHEVLETEGLTAEDRAEVLADLAMALGKAGRVQAAESAATRAESLLSRIEQDRTNRRLVEVLRNRLRIARGSATE